MQKQTKVLLAIIAAVAILGVAVFYSGGGLQGKIKLSSKGKLQVMVDVETPSEDIVVAGTVDKLVSVFKATASGDEGFEIKKLTVINRYDNVKGDTDNNIKTVRLTYTNSSNATVSKEGVLLNGSVSFSGLNVIVPKNENAKINISADFNTIPGVATSGEMVALSIDGFTARGLQSGAVFPGHVVNGLKYVNWMHVYGSKPTLVLNANSPSGSHSASPNDKVFVFDVVADANGGLVVERVLIKMMSDGSFNTNASIKAILQDETGNIVPITNPAKVKVLDDSNAGVELIIQFELSKGETRTLSLVLDTAALMNNQAVVDDLFLATINYGTSSKGLVTPGGFDWEDSTDTDAKWVGAQKKTNLQGNILKY